MAKVLETSVVRVRGRDVASARDWLAVERPLEIRARTGDAERVVSTTMRTPGEDRALTAGFLFGERVITAAGQIRSLESVDDDTVLIELDASSDSALAATQRPFVTTGACGVCGRTTLDALLAVPTAPVSGDEDPRPRITAALVHGLPAALRDAQATFAQTGGLHAAGLFSVDGRLLSIHEDVGRHNAVDKLVGTLLLEGRLGSARDSILVVSGRASFELVQKATAAGIQVMAAVGAPSSLAVEIADRAGMTLLGFVREHGFNVYCGGARIAELAGSTAARDEIGAVQGAISAKI